MGVRVRRAEREQGQAADLPIHVTDEVRVAELAHALPERHRGHAGQQRQRRRAPRREHDCAVDDGLHQPGGISRLELAHPAHPVLIVRGELGL